MRELEGLGHDEIAAALGMSGGAARQAIYRARPALRDGIGLIIPLPVCGCRSTDGRRSRWARRRSRRHGGGGGARRAPGRRSRSVSPRRVLAGSVGTGVADRPEPHATARGRRSGGRSGGAGERGQAPRPRAQCGAPGRATTPVRAAAALLAAASRTAARDRGAMAAEAIRADTAIRASSAAATILPATAPPRLQQQRAGTGWGRPLPAGTRGLAAAPTPAGMPAPARDRAPGARDRTADRAPRGPDPAPREATTHPAAAVESPAAGRAPGAGVWNRFRR